MSAEMKLRVRRRSVLASIGGAAIGMVTFAYPGLASAVAPARHERNVIPTSTPSLRDPGFTGGRVHLKTADTLVVANPEYSRVIRVPPGRTIWKEFDVSIDEVNVGDAVHARGEPQPDGSLLARPGWIWVNIAVWHGRVTGRTAGGVLATRTRGRHVQERELTFSSRVEVISGKDLKPLAQGVGALALGGNIGAVGLALPDGRLRVTRIWVD